MAEIIGMGKIVKKRQKRTKRKVLKQQKICSNNNVKLSKRQKYAITTIKTPLPCSVLFNSSPFL